MVTWRRKRVTRPPFRKKPDYAKYAISLMSGHIPQNVLLYPDSVISGRPLVVTYGRRVGKSLVAAALQEYREQTYSWKSAASANVYIFK